MTVLGHNGRLRLRRETPSTVTVPSSALDATTNTLTVPEPGIWTGDQLKLESTRGLPINIDSSGIIDSQGLAVPDCADGYGFYEGSTWIKSPTRSHINSNNAEFYRSLQNIPQDSGYFYCRPKDVGSTTTATYYCYRDQLDRVSLYATRAEALTGTTDGRITLFNVDFDELTLTQILGNDWNIQSQLLSWSLNLNAPEIDTTAIGERYGDAVKSLITGSGSLDFFIDRTEIAGYSDGTYLLNLLLLTEQGCASEAEFWMITDREARTDCGNYLLPGDLYYSATILITSVAINTRPDEILAGSLNFATIGTVALRMGPN